MLLIFGKLSILRQSIILPYFKIYNFFENVIKRFSNLENRNLCVSSIQGKWFISSDKKFTFRTGRVPLKLIVKKMIFLFNWHLFFSSYFTMAKKRDFSKSNARFKSDGKGFWTSTFSYFYGNYETELQDIYPFFTPILCL